MMAPFGVLLYYSNRVIKNVWLDFTIDSLLILGMTVTPTLFLDVLCLKFGLYSREITPHQARIHTENDENLDSENKDQPPVIN